MMTERASIFGDNGDFDVAGFSPEKPKATKNEPPAEAVKAASERAEFRSREPVRARGGASSRKEPRRYRTGRNVQLNIKVRAEASELFYALADTKGWVLGETFERAIEALNKELNRVSALK